MLQAATGTSELPVGEVYVWFVFKLTEKYGGGRGGGGEGSHLCSTTSKVGKTCYDL